MPVENYGVWKASPVCYTYETKKDDPKSPHLSLYFSDDEPGEARAAINIKSGDQSESRLAYWTVSDFKHPITAQLGALERGFHPLEGKDRERLALDYIRGNIFDRKRGRILPHDEEGVNNDILDVLKPIMDRSIQQKATMYIYGSHFGDGKGIHNVHMNQGSPKKYARANGVWQDGGLIIEFEDHCEGVFIGFASQAVHTDDETGHPIPPTEYLTWADFLEPEKPVIDREVCDLNDTPVLITEALVNPVGPDNQPEGAVETVTLKNRSSSAVNLTGWKIQNRGGQAQVLAAGAELAVGESKAFEVPDAPLSNKGSTITLLNANGLKVHGVSYTKQEARKEGVPLKFT